MRIGVADFCLATKDVARLKAFYDGLLSDGAVEDHQYFFRIADAANPSVVSTVPHSGDPKWDHPWITFQTDDLPGAIARLQELGATDIENSGPTDDDGNPIACVTFRDPDGRLMMLAC